MDQDIYDELPTKYDLYYFKWRFFTFNGLDVSEAIVSRIRIGLLDDQLSEKYLYYLFITLYFGLYFIKDMEYIIVTDDCILSTNPEYLNDIELYGDKFQSNDSYFILNLRGREFNLSNRYIYNCLGNTEELTYRCSHNRELVDYQQLINEIHPCPSINDVLYQDFQINEN
jgi:hypothetical protein